MTRSLAPTPSQTVGPFFGFALPYAGGDQLVPPGHPEAVRLTGRVLDGHGEPVPDAMLEVWQTDPSGRVPTEAGSLRRNGWTFTGWGRASTDNTGRYTFSTLRPGAPEPGRLPFFALVIFARGLTHRLFTRAYLPASEEELAADAFLGSLPLDRRSSLVATENGSTYAFDVRLQGPGETVFLEFGAAL